MAAFTKSLTWLSTQIVAEEDVHCLRFIASSVLETNQHNKTAEEIFTQLQEHELVSQNNIKILYEALTAMKQIKLRTEFLKRIGSPRYKQMGSELSTFVRMLISLHDTIDKESLSSLVFCYKNEDKGVEKHRGHAYDLFQYLLDKLLLRNDKQSLNNLAGYLEAGENFRGQQNVQKYLKDNPNLPERAEPQSTLEGLSPVEDTGGCNIQGNSGTNITGNGNMIIIGAGHMVINKSLGISQEQPVVQPFEVEDMSAKNKQQSVNQQPATDLQLAMEKQPVVNQQKNSDQRPAMNQQIKTDYQRGMEQAEMNQLTSDMEHMLEQAEMNWLTSDVEHMLAMNKQQSDNKQPATELQLAMKKQPVVNQQTTSDRRPAMNQQIKTDYQRGIEQAEMNQLTSDVEHMLEQAEMNWLTSDVEHMLAMNRQQSVNKQPATEHQLAMEKQPVVNQQTTSDRRPAMKQELKTDYQWPMEQQAEMKKLLTPNRRPAMNQQHKIDYQWAIEQEAAEKKLSTPKRRSAKHQQHKTDNQWAMEQEAAMKKLLTPDQRPAIGQQLKTDYQQGMEEKAVVNQQPETDERPEMVQQLATDQNSASSQVLAMNQQPTTDYQLSMNQQPSMNQQLANDQLPENKQQLASDHPPSTMVDTGQPKHVLVSDSRESSPPAVMSPPKPLSSFSFKQPDGLPSLSIPSYPDGQRSSSIPPGLRQGTWCKEKRCYLFQKYEIESMKYEKIGSGGFGIVYKGVWIMESGKNHVEVAIKEYDKETAQKSGQGAKQFEKEINAVGMSQHCFAVTVLGYCHDEEYKALVYPYMEKGDLKALLDKHSPDLTWQIRLRIIHQISRAMCHFHNSFKSRDGLPIVHGDVKANNIFLDKHLNAFLGDFGVMKELPEDVTAITEMDKPFVLGYDDPDAVKHLSISSDVYMFGVVIYRGLTSKPAQQGNEPAVCKSLMSYRKGDFEASYEDLYEVVDRDIWPHDQDEDVKELTKLAIKCFIKKINKVEKKRCNFKEILEKLDCLMKKNKIKEYETNADIRCVCCQINQPVEDPNHHCGCTRVKCESCLQNKDLPCPFHVSSRICEHLTN